MRQTTEPAQLEPAPSSMRSPEDREARTFLAALGATLALFIKPILWGAFVLGLLALMIGEPLS